MPQRFSIIAGNCLFSLERFLVTCTEPFKSVGKDKDFNKKREIHCYSMELMFDWYLKQTGKCMQRHR